ncbi:PLD2 Phospholipase, partial [Atractosteus spatula]|nr:PLD2 Phospholipase [Atractosteus spatula]
MASSEEDVVEATQATELTRRLHRDDLPISEDELDCLREATDERPFLVIHHLQAVREKGVPLLLRDTPVTCKVDSTERHTTRSKMGHCYPLSFILRLTHGRFTWTVKRKYRHFQELHRDLHSHKLMVNFLPLGRFAAERQQLGTMTDELPTLHSADRARRASSKPKLLEDYLNVLLENSFCRNYHGMLEFLDVSPLSFVGDLGPKGLVRVWSERQTVNWNVKRLLSSCSLSSASKALKDYQPDFALLKTRNQDSRKEGFILKRSGGHRILGLNCFGHHQFCYRWSRRWLVVKDSFLLYMKPEAGVISFVLLFDPEFKVQVGRCYTDTKYGVCIQNFTRTLVIKCSSYRQAQWWSHEIHRLSEPCEFLQTHRFDSFAPPREDTLARWYINGREYFADVAQALEQAREEIFITDWWLSPEIYLKRPATSHYWRLDQILKRKAEQGVKVCVLLYKEVELALGINSDYSKRKLMNMHPNIKVMRHPDHVSSIVFLWAHHEKMVAIDQSVAFVGGIDLAYGRWDDKHYRLADLGNMLTASKAADQQGSVSDQRQVSPEDLTDNTRLWLGKDYSNFITKDWVQLDRPFEDNIDRTVVPRMPWRDMAAVVHGKAARDLSRHFIQRWNFTKIFKNKYKDNFYPCLLPKSHSAADSLPFIVPQTRSARVQSCSLLCALESLGKTHLSGQGLQRLLSAWASLSRLLILRSVDRWSAGTCESSIHKAYIDTIESSEHYVYIENQFFISCSDEKSVFNRIGDALVDRILRAHSEKKVFRVYIVVPLLPGFEGDISSGGGTSMQAILHFTYRTMCRGEFSILGRLKEKMQDEWKQYISLCGLRTYAQLPGSLVSELIYVHSKTLIADDRRYIIGETPSSLSAPNPAAPPAGRLHNSVPPRLETGRRQAVASELGLQGLGRPVQARSHQLSAAQREGGSASGAESSSAFLFLLFMNMVQLQHTVPCHPQGTPSWVLLAADSDPCIDIQDPISDEFFQGVWNRIAESNAAIYDMVFRSLPSNSIHNLRMLREYVSVERMAETDPDRAREELAGVRGYLVHFPLNFLCEEYLLPPLKSKERMVPMEVWT